MKQTDASKVLTWRQLREFLSNFPDENYLDFPVAIHLGLTDEFVEASEVLITEDSDVLSKGEPYLTVFL